MCVDEFPSNVVRNNSPIQRRPERQIPFTSYMAAFANLLNRVQSDDIGPVQGWILVVYQRFSHDCACISIKLFAVFVDCSSSLICLLSFFDFFGEILSEEGGRVVVNVG